MKKLIDLTHDEAKKHFLKKSSYFNADIPEYINFENILSDVDSTLGGKSYLEFKATNPNHFSGVNYSLISNKDGKFAWRPLELIHPVICVSLVNVLCDLDNWDFITNHIAEFKDGVVDCCSAPVMSLDDQKDVAKQITSWWQTVEQQSIIYSLDFTHLLHTDVIDGYGSLYTHGMAWALHGIQAAKEKKNDKSLLGNKIDSHIRAGRYGQTNGISQGSVLMDFVAEIVLGFVDKQINDCLCGSTDFRILRYRDDYRIFTNSNERAEEILKIISDKLRPFGMKLGISKTILTRNVIEGAIKPDKLAGIDLQDLGLDNAKTVQKQLLRLHKFGQRFPNSGALRPLVSEFHTEIIKQKRAPEDL